MFTSFEEMNRPLTIPGLGIKGGTGPTIRTNYRCLYTIDSKIYNLTASTDLAPLSGIIVNNGYTKVIGAMIDATGTVSYNEGQQFVSSRPVDLSRDMLLPDQQSNALLGLVIIANASGSTWTGSTDNLDATGVTTIFVDSINALI